MRACVLVEGGPCPPCEERAAIRHQIKQLEEEITKLKAKDDTLRTTINAFHDPFTHKFPPEIASHILQLSLPILNDGEHEREAVNERWSAEWATPLTLGSVGRQWRQLAWATPDLWTTLYLKLQDSPINDVLYS